MVQLAVWGGVGLALLAHTDSPGPALYCDKARAECPGGDLLQEWERRTAKRKGFGNMLLFARKHPKGQILGHTGVTMNTCKGRRVTRRSLWMLAISMWRISEMQMQMRSLFTTSTMTAQNMKSPINRHRQKAYMPI